MRLIIGFTLSCLVVVNAFSPTLMRRDVDFRSNLRMVAASSDSFGDDMPDGHSSSDVRGNIPAEKSQSKFVSGDELHNLRHEVMAMRLELQEARRSGSQLLIRALEKAIMNARQSDAEFVYQVSQERQELAEEKGLFQEAEKYKLQAMDARSTLPQFNLEGLWVGKFGDHGYEMVNVTYNGDVLVASKVTGTKNVPKGEASFEVDLCPKVTAKQDEVLEPIKLGDGAAKQWGSKYLQRFSGKGQVAAEGYLDSQWIDGQLILVNEYFSFAWLPIGHQVFFGRPTPELILKLLKDHERKESGDCSERAFLEKCWAETEHLEDHDIIVNESFYPSDVSASFKQEDGFFE